ncbi:MAG: 3-dehydroquinate synthase [Bacteroidales bacterium]|nr:3-dehydroquinate synthase [Bacteroidales bacterium]
MCFKKKIKLYLGDAPGALRRRLRSYKQVFVVYDANVEAWLPKLNLQEKPVYPVVATEENKNIKTAYEICKWLLEQGADRDALVLAVGGGVTTDIAGFAAGIYKRGIRYANVPTSLVGQVDAGIGGKTGVNVSSFKNMIGLIRQPEFTWICPALLGTLPEKDFLSGSAELLKTFILEDREAYEDAVDLLSAGRREPDAYAALIEKAARIKARIVGKDEKESGLRRVLNLGHTYGHAIEWYQHVHGDEAPLTHGEAVAVGMVKAAGLSEERGYAAPGLASKLRDDFRRCGLPVDFPCPEQDLEEAVSKDKKAEGGRIQFVFIEKIGKVRIHKL